MSTQTSLTKALCTKASPLPQQAYGRRLHSRPLLAALLAVLLPVYAGMAQGEPHRTQHDRESRRDNSGQRPVREAIGEVEQNYRGHVVDVQSLRRDSNEDVYRMRVLQRDGRVKTVTVPANEREQRERR